MRMSVRTLRMDGNKHKNNKNKRDWNDNRVGLIGRVLRNTEGIYVGTEQNRTNVLSTTIAVFSGLVL